MRPPTGSPILVTGAGGFVCGHIVAALLDGGYRVLALDKAFDPGWADRFKARKGQLEQIEGSLDTLGNRFAVAVIHGAAITASPEELDQSPEANLRANLDPMLAVMDWADQIKVRRAIFLSSAAIYRPSPVSSSLPPLDEDDLGLPASLYGVAKQTMEQLVRVMADSFDRPWLCLRLSAVYGPAERERPSRPRLSLVTRLISEALETGTITVNQNMPTQDWTYAPDIGRAICAILDNGASRHPILNIASGQVYSATDLARRIVEVLPSVQLKLDEVENRAMLRGPLANARLRAEYHFDTWTPIQDGIRATVDWLKAHPTSEVAG